MSPRIVPESRVKDMQVHAASKGGRLLSEFWINSKQKYEWECSFGHSWTATWASVGTTGTWCPICAGQTPRSIDELRKTAEERGGKLITTEYVGTENSKYEFECSLGHRFENRFRHIVDRNQWCPICSKGSKSEEVARTHFEQIFGLPFPRVKPKWLRNARNFVMEIDGYCESLQIGFEYQGAQHYKESHYKSNLKQRISDDEDKARICAENGVRLFILSYLMPYENFSDEIKKQAQGFGISRNEFDFDAKIDLNLAFIRDDRLIELKNILAAKSITVLSDKWLGVSTLYDFQCQICKHEWKSRANAYFNSRRVSGCKKCSMRELRDKQTFDINSLNQYASSHGGKVLSKVYVRRNSKYRFECRQGHEFESNFNNMVYRKEFCPICEGRIRRETLTSQEAQSLFELHRLSPIGEYPGPRKIWESKCMNCSNLVSPRLETLRSKGIGCLYCSGFLIDPKQAIKVLESYDLTPLEPFPGSSKKWKVKCGKCESVNFPIYSNLKKGQGGCRTCYLTRVSKKKLDPQG